jgi:hypothetical protein
MVTSSPRAQVCLSLLGTWHGGAASEKWNPDTSGIFQILLSVQVRSGFGLTGQGQGQVNGQDDNRFLGTGKG